MTVSSLSMSTTDLLLQSARMAHPSTSLTRTTQMESTTTRATPTAHGSSCTITAPHFPILPPTSTMHIRLRRLGTQQTATIQGMNMMAPSTPIATTVPASTSLAKLAAPTIISKATLTISRPSISSNTSQMEAS